jgi:hypothetical protein
MKTIDFVRDEHGLLGFVELDESGQWKADGGRYDGAIIGLLTSSRKDAAEIDIRHAPRRVQLNGVTLWWGHQEVYDTVTSFTKVLPSEIPPSIRREILNVAMTAAQT